MRLDGVLVIDKPRGPTSARVVARVKRVLGARKVGHTGTLDPMATGVLPLCLGEATKLAGHLLADDKSYDGELLLGTETDTLDAEGEVIASDPEGAAAVSREALAAALESFRGESEQVPPMYSAIKSGGVRLHELARRGEEVERRPRPIRIDRIELTSFEPPRARFSLDCSKGTYVRSLVADVGRALGCGAHLTELRRTRAGRFGLEAAVPLADLTREAAAEALIAPAAAVGHLPSVAIPPERVAQVGDGLQLRWEQISKDPEPVGTICLLDPDGRLAALARVEDDKLHYERVFRFT